MNPPGAICHPIRIPRRKGRRVFLRSLSTLTLILAGALGLVASVATAAEEWVRHFSSSADDIAVAVSTDANGNVFVTGSSFAPGSGVDFLTLKYSSAGVALWTNRYNGPANREDRSVALAVNTNGDVAIAGSSISSNGYSDFATIQYSNAGIPLWTNRYNGPGNSDDTVSGLAIGNAGTVFVTGTSAATGIPPFDTPANLDIATIAYSSTGTALWTNRYNGPTNIDDRAAGITTDTNGNVLVVGYSVISPTNFNVVILKYSPTGTPLWTNHYHGPLNGDDLPKAIATDPGGNVFIAVRA